MSEMLGFHTFRWKSTSITADAAAQSHHRQLQADTDTRTELSFLLKQGASPAGGRQVSDISRSLELLVLLSFLL